jgi:hypothetical protein
VGTVEFELSAVARVLPSALIQDALREEGREEQRQRKLPAELVAWLVIALGLYRGLSISNVLARLAGELCDTLPWGKAELPHSTSICHARDRLGWTVLRRIFQSLADMLNQAQGELNRWRGLAVYAIDGTTFLTPDTDQNKAWFGKPGSSRGGESAFPQLRGVMVLGAWTHTLVDAVLGPYTLNETKLTEHLVPRLKQGAVYLLDRAYYTFVWPARIALREAYFVVRTKEGGAMRPRKLRCLGRGDWLCELVKPRYRPGRYADMPERILVRMITCHRRGFRPYTVVTNLLSPKDYPAAEIAALYVDRWEIESGYRELKVHMTQKRVTFRSKRPDRVLQEAYGLLLAYNCVRGLMCEAAVEAGVRPVQLSFADCLSRIQWALRATTDVDALVQDLASCVLPPRRASRRFDRAVKVTLSKYPRKRRGQRSAPTRYQLRARSRQWRGSVA